VSRLQSQCSGWPRDSLHDWVSGVSDGWQATEAIDDWRLYSWMASEILRLALSLEDDSKSAQAGGDADLPRGIRPIGPHWELLAPGQMLTIRVAPGAPRMSPHMVVQRSTTHVPTALRLGRRPRRLKSALTASSAALVFNCASSSGERNPSPSAPAVERCTFQSATNPSEGGLSATHAGWASVPNN